jgi:hypothetical protein
MIQNFTSSTQVSVSQTHVDTSALMQLHFGVNQLSLANKDSLGAVPPPLTTGSKVPAHQAYHVPAPAAKETSTGALKMKCVNGCSKKATMKYSAK